MPGPALDLEENAALHAERMAMLQAKLRQVGFPAAYGKDVVPQQYIDVGWGNDKDSEEVALFGNSLTTSRCQDKPVVHFFCRERVFHTIVAFDADYVDPRAPAGAPPQPYFLWCRVNVSGDLKYSSGTDIVRWQPPHPIADSGEHRVFIVVFIQTEGERSIGSPSAVVAKYARRGRNQFDLRRLSTEQRLQFVGANCARFAYDASCVDRVVADLRDDIELDATGKKIVAEIDGGRRTEFGKKIATPPVAAGGSNESVSA